MTRTIIALTTAALALAGCSRTPEEKTPVAASNSGKPTEAEIEAAKSQVKVTPAVPDSATGADRAKMQADLIETMSNEPAVSPEVYEGEAYRRGVTLTPAQIARKKASYRPEPAAATK